MEFGVTIFARFDSVAFFSVEMILPSSARHKFATLSDLESLAIRLVGFHSHKVLYITYFKPYVKAQNSA